MLLYCAAIISLVYLGIILFLRRGLLSLRAGGQPHGLKFSVVIAARNEEKNVEACLCGVLSQTIGPARYEVILVSDRSTDKTVDRAHSLEGRFPNLSVLAISETPAGVSPKKHAVLQGIKRAANEIIVFTDADCRVPRTWLETLDKYLTPETGLVQGITAYDYVPGMNRVFYGLQALDFCSHAVVSAAAIGAGMPVNSNANNLAFRKKAFDDAAGYGNLETVVSGDDDMLLQRIWGKKVWRIAYMADSAGAVTTFPTLTAGGLFEQRKRWGSKTVHYGWRQVAVLSSVFAFYCAIITLVCFGCFFPSLLVPAGSMILVKMAGEAMLMIPGTKMTGQTSLRKYLVCASLIQLPMVIAAVLTGVFGRFVWKDQKFARKTRRVP
jgi:cellulose synthase/poly-beta-1,6-N-acetylglucosamine synthase-like glycosyltransferase